MYLLVVGDVCASRHTAVFSFHLVDFRDGTQLPRRGGACLHQLSHFSSSDLVFPDGSIYYRNGANLLYMECEGFQNAQTHRVLLLTLAEKL